MGATRIGREFEKAVTGSVEEKIKDEENTSTVQNHHSSGVKGILWMARSLRKFTCMVGPRGPSGGVERSSVRCQTKPGPFTANG